MGITTCTARKGHYGEWHTGTKERVKSVKYSVSDALAPIQPTNWLIVWVRALLEGKKGLNEPITTSRVHPAVVGDSHRTQHMLTFRWSFWGSGPPVHVGMSILMPLHGWSGLGACSCCSRAGGMDPAPLNTGNSRAHSQNPSSGS